MNKIYILIFSFIFIFNFANSQCVTTINTFPYNENFEASNGGWTSGGTYNSWAWGSPTKNIINTAGSGVNCWITDGLTGTGYSSCERSWVESPCFDFTTVANPHITMKIYWECENTYDGATFQYSTNGGTTWINVGAFNDPIDCLNQNWFNSGNITHLNSSGSCTSSLTTIKHGWCGNSLPTAGICQGGGGSLGWVTAKHCMSYLAGLPSVKFRFGFGAGSTCNAFDGFAFDDIIIGEAPTNVANFVYSCTGNPLEYQFTNSSALCPSTFTWNFGDVASGVNNTSTLTNPTHTFSSPGTYVVTLTVAGPCNASSTISYTITTLQFNPVSTTNPSCNTSSNGLISTTCINGNGVINYTLLPPNTSNVTGSFNSLNGGTYTISATDAVGCNLTTTANLTTPNPISITINKTNTTCFGYNNGSINATASGGSGSNFSFNLLPSNTTNSSGVFSNLVAGNYTVTVTDGNNCTNSTLVQITQPNAISFSAVNKTDILCNGQTNGSINAVATGGTGTLGYLLLPNNQNNLTGSFANLNAGVYTITSADINGCSFSTTVTINQPAPIVITNVIKNNPNCTVNNSGSINIIATGGTGSYQYSIGGSYSTNATFSNLMAGTFTITVKDANNCSATTIATLANTNQPQFIQSNFTNTKCFNSNDGSIDVVATNNVAVNSYLLMPNGISQTTGQFTNLSAGNYTVTATDVNGCSNTTVLTITSPDEISITSTTVKYGECGQTNTISLQSKAIGGTGILYYTLTPANGTNNSGNFYSLSAGNYTITVTDANNCSVASSIIIKDQNCCSDVFVPTAFSPNNDSKNDELNLLNKFGVELEKFIIVNRFGNIVFSAKHIDDSWDGKYKGIDADLGTYYYLLQYKCASTNTKYIKKGDILLVR